MEKRRKSRQDVMVTSKTYGEDRVFGRQQETSSTTFLTINSSVLSQPCTLLNPRTKRNMAALPHLMLRQASGTEELQCSICFDDVGTGGALDLRLGCRCLLHYKCLCKYIKSQLGDRYQYSSTRHHSFPPNYHRTFLTMTESCY